MKTPEQWAEEWFSHLMDCPPTCVVGGEHDIIALTEAFRSAQEEARAEECEAIARWFEERDARASAIGNDGAWLRWAAEDIRARAGQQGGGR